MNTLYEQKIAEMFAKSQAREEEKRQEFLSKVNQVIVKNDYKPMVFKLTESKKGYIEYTVIKHPTGVCTYTVTFYDTNRQYYKSAEYFYGDIPATHKAQFEALEQML